MDLGAEGFRGFNEDFRGRERRCPSNPHKSPPPGCAAGSSSSSPTSSSDTSACPVSQTPARPRRNLGINKRVPFFGFKGMIREAYSGSSSLQGEWPIAKPAQQGGHAGRIMGGAACTPQVVQHCRGTLYPLRLGQVVPVAAQSLVWHKDDRRATLKFAKLQPKRLHQLVEEGHIPPPHAASLGALHKLQGRRRVPGKHRAAHSADEGLPPRAAELTETPHRLLLLFFCRCFG